MVQWISMRYPETCESVAALTHFLLLRLKVSCVSGSHEWLITDPAGSVRCLQFPRAGRVRRLHWCVCRKVTSSAMMDLQGLDWVAGVRQYGPTRLVGLDSPVKVTSFYVYCPWKDNINITIIMLLLFLYGMLTNKNPSISNHCFRSIHFRVPL